MVIDFPYAELAGLGVDKRALVLIAVAAVLMLIGVVATVRQKTAGSRMRSKSPTPDDKEAVDSSAQAAFAAPGAPVLHCRAELLERRPLSEAQWDSPVPAAWTIFRLTLEEEETAQMQLGLLLPVQHKEAYSSGFLERLESTAADPILKGFARALSGPLPGPAITGSAAGFLEFKTYVQNEKPDIIPGNLDLSAADYWIFVKIFVQNTLEFYLRVNPQKQEAEIAAARPAHGEELMRVLAATLRPESAAS